MRDTAYELRPLCGDDIFPMFSIISKIGIEEFKDCTGYIKQLARKTNKENEEDVETAGINLALKLAPIVLSHVPDCKNDIYTLLSQMAGVKRDDIAMLSAADFASMIIEVFKQDNFADFIKVVSKLSK